MTELVKAMEKYVAIGEKLGLKGSELQAFLDEQHKAELVRANFERDERAKQREFEAQQRTFDADR